MKKIVENLSLKGQDWLKALATDVTGIHFILNVCNFR